MARLFRKLVALSLPFALLFLWAEWRLRQLPNSYSVARAALEQALPELQVLILGSSHAQNGVIVGEMVEASFNLANGSQSLYYDAKLVERFAPRAPSLRLVVFTVSYFSFQSRLDKSIESWRTGFYRQVFGIGPEEEGWMARLRDQSYVLLYSPRIAYSLLLGGLGVTPSKSDRSQANVDAAGRGSVTDAFGAERVRFHEATMYKQFTRYNREAIEGACRTLGERGVMVALVTTPVHHTYLDHVDPQAYEVMLSDARATAQACRATYHDLARDPRFGTEDFVNSDHLNPIGAAKFTRILDEEVVKPVLSGR